MPKRLKATIKPVAKPAADVAPPPAEVKRVVKAKVEPVAVEARPYPRLLSPPRKRSSGRDAARGRSCLKRRQKPRRAVGNARQTEVLNPDALKKGLKPGEKIVSEAPTKTGSLLSERPRAVTIAAAP